MILEAFSVSHGKVSAYLPVIELLRSYFGILDEDDHGKRSEKINGKILTLDRNLEDTIPALLSLLGLAGDEPQLTLVGRGQAKSITELPAELRFPPDYRVPSLAI